MKIRCVRCGKEIESPNANNAKYIMNPNDTRTFGKDKVEKIIKAPLSEMRIGEIIKELKIALKDFLKLSEIFPDEYGRREVVREVEIERPKTAIVCIDCLQEDDDIIW